MAIDETCSTQSALPQTLIISLLVIYWSCVLIASIRSFIELKFGDDDFQTLGCFGKIKTWIKDTWRRKKCYLEIFPHITDTATDVGVLIEFYQIASKQQQHGRSAICSALNMTAIFWVSVSIMLLYRIVSSLQIWLYTKSIRQTLFQFLDIEIFHAFMINYKTKQKSERDKDEPCQPQKWISDMEATFESVPQSWIQLIYLISSGIFFNQFGVVQLSFVWSVFVVVLRNSSEDKRLFENAMTDRLKARLKENNIAKSEWKTVPSKWLICLPFRFCDIFCRIVILSISYVLLKWYIFVALNAAEMLILIYIATKTKRWDRLNHFIRTELDVNFINSRILINSVWILWIYFAFSNKLIGNASDIGTLILVIICMLCVLFLSVLFFVIYKKMKWFTQMNFRFFNEVDIFHTSRRVSDLIKSHHWNDILDLIYFGFDTTPNKLMEQHPNLLELISEDFRTGQAFLGYLMGGIELDIAKFQDIWNGTLQAFENKDTELQQENKGDSKKMKKKRKALHEEFAKIIEFLKQLLSNDKIKNDHHKLAMLLNSRTTHHHRTILHVLVLKRIGKDFLDELCENAAINPNIQDKYNETALHIVTKTKEDKDGIAMTQTLLGNKNTEINISNRFNRNETALHYCIAAESRTLCGMLLRNTKLNIHQLTSYGDTYLHYSAKRRNEEIALMVVDEKQHNIPDINARDQTAGDTALHLSMSKARLFETLVTVFHDRIDLNVHNKEGVVPLMNAAEYTDNNHTLDLLLIQAKLEVNAVDNAGNAALHRITCKDNTLANFTKLLKHPTVSVNLQNKQRGYAPLHIAYAQDADNWMYQKMQLLLAHCNINVNLQTTLAGNTALHFGVDLELWWKPQRRSKLILLLSQPNINTNVANYDRKTAADICKAQIAKWRRELRAAKEDLVRKRNELERYQRIYEGKKREYDDEYRRYGRVESEYNKVKAEYDAKKAEYDAYKSEYDRAEYEERRNLRRPGSAPSDYKVNNMKSELDAAKRKLDEKEMNMNTAKRDRDAAQDRVDEAIRHVEKCQNALNAAHEIDAILRQYMAAS